MQQLRELWRVWSRDPIGSLLTVVGVVLGSASLVFLASGLQGASYAMARTSQSAAGDDIVSIFPKRADNPRADIAPELSSRDADALRSMEALREEDVGTGTRLHRREASVGEKTMLVGVQSGGARWMRITGVEVLHGRMLQPHDEGRRRCVIGHDIWKQVFDGKWPLTSSALILDGATKLAVVGVLRPRPPMGGGSGGETWRVDRKIFVSDATFERAVQGGPHAPSIALKYREGDEDARTTSLRLKPYVTALHRGVENFTFAALGKGMALDEIITAALMAVLLLGGLVAIAVGGINVMNSQLMTVTERAQEFAIRRALGLSAAALRRGVLLEAVTITGAGASVGVLLGLGTAWGLSLVLTALVAPWPFSPVPWSIAASLAACLIAGLIAGWVPARRASALPPAAVLRGE
jgi:ABC-type antimicrobial peptide transport system permease subunit